MSKLHLDHIQSGAFRTPSRWSSGLFNWFITGCSELELIWCFVQDAPLLVELESWLRQDHRWINLARNPQNIACWSKVRQQFSSPKAMKYSITRSKSSTEISRFMWSSFLQRSDCKKGLNELFKNPERYACFDAYFMLCYDPRDKLCIRRIAFLWRDLAYDRYEYTSLPGYFSIISMKRRQNCRFM